MEEKKFNIPVYSTDDGKNYINAKHISEKLTDNANENNNGKVIYLDNYLSNEEDNNDLFDDYPTLKDDINYLLSKIKRNVIKDDTGIKEVIKKGKKR